jgi:hypothetical protein
MVKKSILCLPFVTYARGSANALGRRKVPVTYSDDGCHELNQEVRKLQQRGEEMVQEIDEEPFDVRTVMILCARGQVSPSLLIALTR